MRESIAAINMTLDGFCDDTAVDADAEIHAHTVDCQIVPAAFYTEG